MTLDDLAVVDRYLNCALAVGIGAELYPAWRAAVSDRVRLRLCGVGLILSAVLFGFAHSLHSGFSAGLPPLTAGLVILAFSIPPGRFGRWLS